MDRTGARWDVVAGRESWGALVAIFVPREEEGEGIRQAPLGATGYAEAVDELGKLSDDDLGALLDESVPKPR